MDVTEDALRYHRESILRMVAGKYWSKLTGQPPLVLILNIRAIRPLIHSNHELIRSFGRTLEQMCHIELSRVPRALSVANQHAVEPDMICAVNAIEAQPHLRDLSVTISCGHAEDPAVCPCWILRWNVRWAYWNRILNIYTAVLVVADGHWSDHKLTRIPRLPPAL